MNLDKSDPFYILLYMSSKYTTYDNFQYKAKFIKYFELNITYLVTRTVMNNIIYRNSWLP